MNLLEHQGKALLERHGVPIPRGALWPETPDISGRLVLKAQARTGKRGKAGGIRFVGDAASAAGPAAEIARMRIDGQPVEAVLVEEELEIAQEVYLAVALDRDRRCLVILASPHGGMDVEEAPGGDLLTLPIDPLLGLRPFHVARAVRALRLAGDDGAAAAVVEGVFGAALAEDAELVEVNPLVVTSDGRVLAADAKVTLDDNARFRRAEGLWSVDGDLAGRTALEAAVAETGAVGIEVDPGGDVVAVVSGAGLMMATLDSLCEAGHSVRFAVDLGGTVLAGGETLSRVFAAVSAARPRTVLLNAYMHTAFCDELARTVGEAHAKMPLEARVIVRLKGRNSDAGRETLRQLGFDVHADLRPALAAVAGDTGAA